MIQGADAWLFDTDMQIHRLGLDAQVRAAVAKKRAERAPVAVSAYSLLEFKGNYIACLILLRRKVVDSSNLKQVFGRVQATGGRKAALMIAQLVHTLADLNVTFQAVWAPAQGLMVTHIDAEIASTWQWFKSSVDTFVDDLNCTRAAEAPFVKRGDWINDRPDCHKDNTNCRVVQLMRDNEARLRSVVAALKGLQPRTKELDKILSVLERTLVKMEFPWEGTTCKSVGDLLIGLHAPPRQGLATSNRAEHALMAAPMGYAVDILPIGGTRLK